jgi:hypothetical protein
MCVKVDECHPLPDYMQWVIETQRDLRLPAFVSLIKAAHLSMFAMFGYHHVLADAGRLIGQDMPGGFYRMNANIHNKRVIQKNALEYFRPYRFFVQPIPINTTSLEGTLTDGIVHLCAGSSGPPSGMIIYVKTGPITNAVLLPFPDNPESNGCRGVKRLPRGQTRKMANFS